jgi:hypothetical protein
VKNIKLLLSSELYKVYGIAADPDCKLRVLFWILHSVHKHILVYYIYIDMVACICEVAVEQFLQVAYSVVLSLAQRPGYDAEGV